MADMPKFAKSSAPIVDRFALVMDGFPEVERRKMFGYPAAFVGGNMATGLFADQWVVRLPDDQIEPARAVGAELLEVMPGKTMKAFVVIPATDVEDDAALRGWVERGLAHAASMPAKK